MAAALVNDPKRSVCRMTLLWPPRCGPFLVPLSWPATGRCPQQLRRDRSTRLHSDAVGSAQRTRETAGI